jgi:hypothetical protein
LNRVARGLFPGGVSSPVRAFKAVGGEPPVIRRAKGPFLWDVDRRRYVEGLATVLNNKSVFLCELGRRKLEAAGFVLRSSSRPT